MYVTLLIAFLLDDWNPNDFKDLSGAAVLSFVAILVITDKLVWHTRLKKVERRNDRLEELLWVSVGITERTTNVLADAQEKKSP